MKNQALALIISLYFLPKNCLAQETEDWRKESSKHRGIETPETKTGNDSEPGDGRTVAMFNFALQGGFPMGQFGDTAAKYQTSSFGFNIGAFGRLNHDKQWAVFLGGIYEYQWWGTDNENLTTIKGVTTGVELVTRSNAFNIVARLQPVKGKFRYFIEAGPGVRFYNTNQILVTNQIPGTASGGSGNNNIIVNNGDPGNTTFETKTRISLSTAYNLMLGGGIGFELSRHAQLDLRLNYFMSTTANFVHPNSLRIAGDNETMMFDRQTGVRLNQITAGVGLTFLIGD